MLWNKSDNIKSMWLYITELIHDSWLEIKQSNVVLNLNSSWQL